MDEKKLYIDFDEIDTWTEQLNMILISLVNKSVKEKLGASTIQYAEDARDLLFHLADREKIIDATLTWILSANIIGYHGSRLINDDILTIQKDGLIPLNAEARKKRLRRALSKHSRWLDVETKLEKSIQKFGQGCYNGKREGQVHLTLSKAGLINTFNHYLSYGSEFDQRVAFDLLGAEGKELLKEDGTPKLIRLSVPGSLALTASHPYFSIDCLREKGEIPNIVKDIIAAWAFKLTNTSFQSRTLEIDCGMIFFETIPASWIVDIETNLFHDFSRNLI